MKVNVERRLQEVLGEWRDRWDRGVGESAEELIRANPTLANELRCRLSTEAHMVEGVRDVRAFRDGRIGPYLLCRRLGGGGAGEVFEAEPEGGGGKIALKIYDPNVTASAGFVERLERQVAALRIVDHPGIVRVFSLERHQGLWCTTSELVPGRSLADVIRSERGPEQDSSPRPPAAPDRPGPSALGDARRVAALFAGVAEAVAAAHKAGVLHRDIKPGNLILTEAGSLRIIDFDLGRFRIFQKSLTRTGQIVGTPEYMSPERARGESDPRSDVYSLGVALYETLALRLPFKADSLPDLWGKVLHSPPPPLRAWNPAVPRALAAIVTTAMLKESARRYQSAAELAENLRSFLARRRIVSRGPRLGERLDHVARTHPRLLLAGVPGLILALLLATLLKAHLDRLGAARRADAIVGLLPPEDPGKAERLVRLEQKRDLLRRRHLPEWTVRSWRIEVAKAEREFDDARAEQDGDRILRTELSVWADSVRRGAPGDAGSARKAAARKLWQARREARAGGNRRRSDILGQALARFDPEGAWPTDPKGQVRLVPRPPTASLHLLRWTEEAAIENDALPRLVPVPMDLAGRSTGLRHPCLRVAKGGKGLERGDFIVEVEGRPAEGVFVSRSDLESVRPGQRIESSGFSPVYRLHDWRTLPHGLLGGPDVRTVVIGGRSIPIPLLAGADDALGVASMAVDRMVSDAHFGAGLRLGCVSGEGAHEVVGPVPCEVASCALDLSTNTRVPGSEWLELEEGSYLVVARHGGYEELRVNFVVHADSREEIPIDLPPEGSCPEGCVAIPPGPFRSGGRVVEDAPRVYLEERMNDEIRETFFIRRTEVTYREFLSFVAETRREDLLPRDNTMSRLRVFVTKVGDGYEPAAPRTWDHPVDGVSFHAALEFVRWLNAKGGPHVWSLPTESEWERAARGVDGRVYPWGNGWSPSLCVCKTWGIEPGSVPVGSEPFDESPYGVLDMAGSLWEFCGNGVLRGGHWGAHEEGLCSTVHRTVDAAANRFQVYQGFRLVARPRQAH